MATNIHVLPSPPAVNLEAAECDVHIRAAVRSYNRAFASVAHWGWKLKQIDGYPALGYPTEYDYFLSLNISRSWYYHAVAIGRACAHLSEQELGEIPVAVAELMLSVRPEIRTLYPWADEAKTLSYGQFARNVDDRNATVPGESSVRQAVLGIRVAATAKEAILQNIAAFKQKHDLSSPGQALEFMVADRWDRTNVLGSIDIVRKVLGHAATVLRPLEGAAAKEAKQDIKVARVELEQVYRDLIGRNREVGDEVRAAAVSPEEPGTGDQEDFGRPDSDEAERSGFCPPPVAEAANLHEAGW